MVNTGTNSARGDNEQDVVDGMIVDIKSGTVVGNAPNGAPSNYVTPAEAATKSEARMPDAILPPPADNLHGIVDNVTSLLLASMGYKLGTDPVPYIKALKGVAAGADPIEGETVIGNAPNFRSN
jgi:hypothetical protein